MRQSPEGVLKLGVWKAARSVSEGGLVGQSENLGLRVRPDGLQT